ncbi:hypothetical protein J6590_066431 [Homalodisca vitripennis]|nr:hypothetical protein J6590_066431 [Homalodisca vitripennis]
MKLFRAAEPVVVLLFPHPFQLAQLCGITQFKLATGPFAMHIDGRPGRHASAAVHLDAKLRTCVTDGDAISVALAMAGAGCCHLGGAERQGPVWAKNVYDTCRQAR